MANTSWNPADKASNVTLTGSNLTATTGAGGFGWVRAAASATSGKAYWEQTATTFTNGSSAIGIATPTASISSGLLVAGTCSVTRAGTVAVDGNAAGVNIGTIASGTLVCIAIDVMAHLAWFRSGAAGNWNNSGAANPATGVGGVSIPILSPASPALSIVAVGDAVTANFGDAAFSGVVPAGFTAGFPPVAGPSTTVFLTTGTTWTVPADWNNAANTIECVGGGGGATDANSSHVGTGGEGGHYARSQNVTLTPSGTINIAVGAGGVHGTVATATNGGTTWFGGTSLATSFCGAIGGAHGTNSASNATTATTNNVGNIVVRQGGFGCGVGTDHDGGTGGGGAAGPGGVGGGGGNDGTIGYPGGGGGGAGNTGGAGGVGANGDSATGVSGGTGGTAGDGTAGGGTGAAGSRGSGGGGGTGQSPNTAGGAGGAGVDSTWDATHGPGGGGGGGGSFVANNAAVGGNGGLYGGGGGGGAYASSTILAAGGNGAQGIIVVKYTSSVVATSQARVSILA
jgi:hypothetical protein